MTIRRVLLGVTLLLYPFAVSPAQDPRIAQIREYLTGAANLGQLHGSVLVAERGRVLVDTAFGFANMELGVRNTPDTRFRVASVTKQFTAMAIMLLAQDGKLNIADPITKWVDSLPDAWGAITIHHLLRHTSGISDYEEWFDGYTTQAYSDYMSQQHAPARILRDAKRKPLDFAPGSQFHYSNSAYILLGYIVERASGMPYDQFLATRIHQPLGMTLSAQDRSELIIPNRAHGYQMRPGTFPVTYLGGMRAGDYRNAVYQLMEPPQADAGLITTARDLYKWDQALYGTSLLRPALRDSLFAPGLGKYAYGWFINEGPDGITHEHSGGLPGYTCYIMRIPGTQRTIILLTNTDRLGRTVRDIAAIMRGEAVATPRAHRIVPHDPARHPVLAGTYRSARDSVRVAAENGVLVASQAGRFRAQLLPESANDFHAPQLNAMVHFREIDGRLELAVIDGLGKEMFRGVKR